jgi:thymidine kinase
MTGRLDVITGPMFAGKTSALLRRLTTLREAGRNVAAFKPGIDGRYATDAIVSHTGLRFSSQSFEQEFPPRVPHGYEVFGVDEVQFVSEEGIERILREVFRGLHVIVGGLDLTAQGQPFGSMPLLLAHATDVVKLHASCAQCGADASRTQRLIASDAEILVGGVGMYEPRCLSCFVPAA